MKVYFYTLSDPITEEICYVGQTNNPVARAKQHKDLGHIGGNFLKFLWIGALHRKGLEPKFTVIYETDDNDVFWKPTKLEAEFIEEYWQMGEPLLNVSSAKKHRSHKKYPEYIKRISNARFYQVHGFNWY